MGDLKRLAVYVVAIVGIGLSLVLPWWSGHVMGMPTEVTLRGVEVCGFGTCRDAEAGGAFGVIGYMTMIYGWVLIVGLILGGLVPALNGLPTHPKAIVAPWVWLAFAALAYFTLDTEPDVPRELAAFVSISVELDRTWWFWAGIAGALLAGLAPAIARIGSASPVDTVLPYRPPDPIDHDAATAEPPRAAPCGLRFALETAALGEDAIVAVDEDGRRRTVTWAELGGVLARELRDPPRPDLMLVDLVPKQGAPLRLVSGTRVELSGAPATGRDALRRAVAFARAMNPALEVEPATADFLYKGGELPPWTPAELDRYDARYRPRSIVSG